MGWIIFYYINTKRGEIVFLANSIQKRYGNSIILNDLDFTVNEGSITSIIGPNGAGKSTLLGILSRTLDRDSGSVLLNNRDILDWDNSELAKKISILKQSGIISSRITVRDLVEFGRYPYTKGRLKDCDNLIVNNTLEYMNLSDLELRYLDELSGGQRQRAYIASLLSQDTKYIMLDEPLNNLDMRYASDLLKILKKLVKDLKKTVIIVIHDINIAASYSDYIALLKNGNVVIHDTVDKVMNPEVLNKVYDMEFKIREFDGQKMCTYY